MTLMTCSRRALSVMGIAIAMATAAPAPAQAKDLGVEGQVFEPIEEDMRIMLMRLLARQNWDESIAQMQDSAKNYTKNLPAYFLPRAEKTETVWKDVGVVVTEDIYLPWVDWEKGSVFEPQQKLAVEKGTYINPISKLPAGSIERLFIFDSTDPEQLLLAKNLMKQKIPQLSFMLVAGDLGELSKEMNQPVYHPTPTMLEKFHVKAVPTLIGFGRGMHQGHMAVTALKLPVDASIIKRAWFGLPHPGYAPDSLSDVVPNTPSVVGATEQAQDVITRITTPPAAEPNFKR